MEQAKKAGLVGAGSAWTSHPGRMLWARASKNVIVDYAPAVALGLALDDEAVEYTGTIVDATDVPDWPEEEPAAQYEKRVEQELAAHADEVYQDSLET